MRDKCVQVHFKTFEILKQILVEVAITDFMSKNSFENIKLLKAWVAHFKQRY